MSKQQILDVCTLAAHLAQRSIGEPPYRSTPHATQAAADAMKLQRLGRRARNNETKRCNVPDYYRENEGDSRPDKDCKYQLEFARIARAVREVLNPYGLRARTGGDPRGCCLHILGLPGNTLGGDGDGYGI